MPNWVNNILTLRSKDGDPEHIINFIKQHYNKHGLFDFNTFIHEPLSEEDCPDEYNFNINEGRFACNKDTLENPSDRKWYNWLDWRRKHWGTKWNAGSESMLYYSLDKIRENYSYFSPVRIFFQTAWNPPFPIFEKVYNMHPELDVDILYYSTENCDFGQFFSWYEDNHEITFCHYELKDYSEETINNSDER